VTTPPRRLWLLLLVAAVVVVVVVVVTTRGSSRPPTTAALPLRTVAQLGLPGDTSRFDHASLDMRRGLLFIAHLGASEVIEVDIRAHRVVRTIPNLSQVHGVLVVPALRRVYVTATGSNQMVSLEEDTDLVWSPDRLADHLLALINGAQHSLDVEQEEFGDTALVNAIVTDARRGVAVRVVVENQNGTYNTQLNQVTAAGGKTTTYPSNTGFFIHAKTIIADIGTSTAKIYLGSENFSDNSLNHNRELGVIINDTSVLSGVESAFTADFNHTPSGGT
jgi:phosphatidylserine/phosphatidylglycerophosphate/cardiolipin synthase-like enzyme